MKTLISCMAALALITACGPTQPPSPEELRFKVTSVETPSNIPSTIYIVKDTKTNKEYMSFGDGLIELDIHR